MSSKKERTGLAGRIAAAFIDSKLTPLIIAASLVLGLFAVWVTPREEEPQIVVPVMDVFTSMPGASSAEVEERLTKPLEKKLWEVPGVEYVYSMSKPGMSVIIVRFLVGQGMEDSLVNLYNKLMSNMDILPPGSSQPLVKPRSIDDVPILALTLSSGSYDAFQLRRISAAINDEIKQVEQVSETVITGGPRRQLKVLLQPGMLAARNVSSLQVMNAIRSANSRLASGSFEKGNREAVVETGDIIISAEDLGRVVVAAPGGRPVYLRDVAKIADGPEEPKDYVFFGQPGKPLTPGVTISVAKRKGANATWVAEAVLDKVEALKGRAIPRDVTVTVTRNYGVTAKEKSDELLKHMFIATMSVTLLIALFLGLREAGIVAIAIPVTLALTVLIFYLYGYTLNRVTLFALIFSIGILVDDAIVVVENIHRYVSGAAGGVKRSFKEAAIKAVDEVGNPTILATFAVIASLLPMGFVSGLMGPYMRPIPIGASAAMLFSLAVAFIITPWAAMRLLKKPGEGGHAAVEHKETQLTQLYRRIMTPLIYKPTYRYGFLAGVALVLLLACSMVYFKLVPMKMLPFDNKSEFQVIIDMPEGTTLEQTTAVALEMGNLLKGKSEVRDYQIYAGTAAPYNFNGLVRHYFLRSGSNVADIQVNLVHGEERKEQSHDIAKRLRVPLAEIAKKHGARVKVVEIPPGPPVLDTLVTEVYGPSREKRTALAGQIMGIYESTPGVVDIDSYDEDDQVKYRLVPDGEKAALSGISTDEIAKSVAIALTGQSAGLAHMESEREPVDIFLRFPIEARSGESELTRLYLTGRTGANVPLAALVKRVETIEDKTLYRKNLMPVTYVIGDVSGGEESPVYSIMTMMDKVNKIKTSDGSPLETFWIRQPSTGAKESIKWDGEWHITWEVARDMGLAFAAVLVLIYLLVVAWFKSFTTPLVIMAPIPLTLIGIMPGHWAFGAFFTATSMIGFMALAGIIVRNSIILIDFVQLRRREGMPLEEAIIDAGAVRFRPMLLTASAVIVGSFVILFDPIFQGLAIALMTGEIASTLLSRMTIPVLYYLLERRKNDAPVVQGGS
ncbi:MAG: efflux RND transporter permease subunit [Nitrospirota bacterium]|nr:efflux RND transporter permease subunit [Nitrospirota bacterium]